MPTLVKPDSPMPQGQPFVTDDPMFLANVGRGLWENLFGRVPGPAGNQPAVTKNNPVIDPRFIGATGGAEVTKRDDTEKYVTWGLIGLAVLTVVMIISRIIKRIF